MLEGTPIRTSSLAATSPRQTTKIASKQLEILGQPHKVLCSEQFFNRLNCHMTLTLLNGDGDVTVNIYIILSDAILCIVSSFALEKNISFEAEQNAPVWEGRLCSEVIVARFDEM